MFRQLAFSSLFVSGLSLGYLSLIIIVQMYHVEFTH